MVAPLECVTCTRRKREISSEQPRLSDEAGYLFFRRFSSRNIP